jgi:excisionase family DNA binding protein
MQDQAPAPEYLTVRELAALLRLKERKVYDLAAAGQVPCSRATGKLLFPAAEIRAWIAASQSGALPAATSAPPRPLIVLGSHDPLLDWAVRQSGSGLATYYDGSLDGVQRFARGEGVMAGLHLRDATGAGWNRAVAAEHAGACNAALIGFARRRRGFVTRPDGPAPITCAELAGLRVVPRQPGSGTEALFQTLVANAGVPVEALAFSAVARTEDDAAEALRRGEADVAFGLESVAQSHGLVFHPVVDEEFALLVDRAAWFAPPLQAFVRFCHSEEFAARAKAMGGYDLAPLAEMLWNA